MLPLGRVGSLPGMRGAAAQGTSRHSTSERSQAVTARTSCEDGCSTS
jgi:hypothetical protein